MTSNGALDQQLLHRLLHLLDLGLDLRALIARDAAGDDGTGDPASAAKGLSG